MVPGFVWHAHEMLFGYSAAVLAGCFLTAVPSWTDSPSVRGRPLAILFCIWLLGRIALWLSTLLPPWLVAVVDLRFLAALVLFLVPALTSAKKHNLAFIPLLGLLMGPIAWSISTRSACSREARCGASTSPSIPSPLLLR